MMLLTIPCRVNNISLPYFTVRSLYFIIPFPFPPNPLPSSPLATIFVLCIYEFVFFFCLLICFVFWNPYISEIIWYFSFSVLLTLVNIIPSRSAVPNLFGTRDWIRGRQFFHGWGQGGVRVGEQEAELRQ